MTECVSLSAGVDISEERERADNVILVVPGKEARLEK